MNPANPFKFLVLLVVTGLLSAIRVRADVTVNGMFGDHMILQRDQGVPVWGTATPGETVTVTFGGQTVTAIADKDGNWLAKLEPLKASTESRALDVAGSSKVEFQDVLVGDVWVCSGQSNMELSEVGTYKGLPDAIRDQEIAAANFPNIRLNKITQMVAAKPLSNLKGNWTLCTPDTMRPFSTAAYFFGRELRQKLDVPIGLVGCYYGNSNGISWTRREALENDPALAALVNPAPADALAVALVPSTANRYIASNFYNGMIAPMMPFAIKGVIWYQGEADTANPPDQAVRYANVFSAMILDWRAQWKQGDFPFIFVQLPTAELQYPNPTDSNWARVREAQQKTLELSNTAMIVTIDIGAGEVVLAPNKKDVGLRLAAAALNTVYDKKDVPYQGPVFKSMDIANGQAVLTFDHAAGGLASKNPYGVKGFAIAGADKKFAWADAKIDGEKVIVSSTQVEKPVAVRYAWADNPEISVFNKDDLPMAPFRTDTWAPGEAGQVSNPRAVP